MRTFWSRVAGSVFVEMAIGMATLAVVLSGSILWGLSPQTTDAKPRGSTDPCIVLVEQLARESVTYTELDILLHSIGCDQDAGGVYVKPTSADNRCTRYAYNAAKKTLSETGRVEPGLVIVRTNLKNCDYIDDDGTYRVD